MLSLLRIWLPLQIKKSGLYVTVLGCVAMGCSDWFKFSKKAGDGRQSAPFCKIALQLPICRSCHLALGGSVSNSNMLLWLWLKLSCVVKSFIDAEISCDVSSLYGEVSIGKIRCDIKSKERDLDFRCWRQLVPSRFVLVLACRKRELE